MYFYVNTKKGQIDMVLDIISEMDKDTVRDFIKSLATVLTEDECIDLYHHMAREYHWTGTFFTIADIESYLTDDPDAEYTPEFIEAVTDSVLESYEWSKGIQDTMCEVGFDLIGAAIHDIVDSPEGP